MKRTLLFLLLLCALPCFAQPIWPLTTNTMFIKVYDSFDFSLYGNRYGCYEEAANILMDPTNIIRVRTISESGDDDAGALTNRQPKLGTPLAGAMHGTNDIIVQLYCSGNHSPSSNYTYTNMVARLQWPVMTFDKNGNWTNDYPFPTNNIRKMVFGDAGYYQPATLDSDTQGSRAYLYSLGGSNAAYAANVPFVDSYHNNIALITNGYPGNSNEWFNAPAYDHPGPIIQTGRAIKDLISEGMDTNAFTWVQNWNSTTATTAQNCNVSGISLSGNTLTASLTPRRLAMPVEVADANHTNDGSACFVQDVTLTNLFHEDVHITGAPAGTHVIKLNGVAVYTNTTLTGDFVINFFHIYSGPIHDQKMGVLDGCRRMRDVSTNDASTDQAGNNMLTSFFSEAASLYSANTGVSNYTATMLPYEQAMEALDNTNHMAAQPQTFTFTDTVIQTVYLPIHR